MKEYFKRTWKNKLISICLVAVGCISLNATGDITVSVLMLALALPLFFASENYIEF